jgi:hypothetical protein
MLPDYTSNRPVLPLGRDRVEHVRSMAPFSHRKSEINQAILNFSPICYHQKQVFLTVPTAAANLRYRSKSAA